MLATRAHHLGATGLMVTVGLAASSGPASAPATGAAPGAHVARAVEAAFLRESYAPGATARLVIFNRAHGLTLQVLRSGPERVVTRSSSTMNGVPVTRKLAVGSSDRGIVEVKVGRWPSGLYFARLRAADGRVGFAPFVVRPRRLGEHRVAVVLPTLTWQAYNFRDEDCRGGSWYADWTRQTLRLVRAHRSRGVPFKYHRWDLPFVRWLVRTGKDVDVLSQSDLASTASPRALSAAYALIVFPGHHEYVTTREYDLVEGYRNLGGNLMFLSANNFYWRVERYGDLMTKTRLWRDLGRPESAVVGVQYRANNGKAPTKPWIVRRSRAGSWIFAGTGLRRGSAFASGGIEIDRTSQASPPGVEVVAEIPNVFGGRTAQMTYYETRAGASVFAAGAFELTRRINVDPVVSRLIQNLWTRFASD